MLSHFHTFMGYKSPQYGGVQPPSMGRNLFKPYQLGPALSANSAASRPERKKHSRWKQVIEVLLAFGIFGVILWANLASPRLTTHGTYNAVQRTIYTMIVTLLATILTAAVVDGLRTLCLYQVDDKLGAYLHMSAERKSKLDSRWQTVLGIGGLMAKLRNFSLESVLLLGAFTTTCITAGLTATSATRVEPYDPYIPSSDPFIFAQPWDLGKDPGWGFLNWNLNNGSKYCVWLYHGGSPHHKAQALMNGINIRDPALYAYADGGVAVKSSAIGAPVTLYNPEHESYGLWGLLEKYEWNVNSASACVPVMTRNPVRCRPGGKLMWPNGGKAMKITADDGSCSAQRDIQKLPTEEIYIMKHLCTRGEVGQAVAIFGAANGNYAQWMASTVGVDIGPSFPGQNFSVQCDIDVRNGVFQYRNVTLSLSSQVQEKAGAKNLAFNRVLSAGETCSPPGNPAVADALLATAALGGYFPIYGDGGNWIQNIVNVASSYGDYGHAANESIRRAPFAFNDSRNALEDVLGLAGAFTVSRAVLNMSLIKTTGSAEVVFMRVGPGKLFAMVYAFLPFFLGIYMVVLLFRTAGSYATYRASKLGDLVQLGKDSQDEK